MSRFVSFSRRFDVATASRCFVVCDRILILVQAKTKSVTLNGGMPMPAWSDIFGLDASSKEDAAGFEESFARIKSIINQTIASGIPASNIVVGGFSQGGAVALHTAMRLTIPIAGYIALSTWLPFASSYPKNMAAPAKKAKILQVRLKRKIQHRCRLRLSLRSLFGVTYTSNTHIERYTAARILSSVSNGEK